MEDDAIVSGGVGIPEHLIDRSLEQLGPLKTELGRHLALLLALHPKLKEKFFELYTLNGIVYTEAIDKLDEVLQRQIIGEINEVLNIKPFKLTTIYGEV